MKPNNGRWIMAMAWVVLPVLAGMARAAAIPIANNSFETPFGYTSTTSHPSWTVKGNNGEIDNTSLNLFSSNVVLNGVQFANVLNQNQWWQTLGTNLTVDTRYTLSGLVGNYDTISPTYQNQGYELALIVGDYSDTKVRGTDWEYVARMYVTATDNASLIPARRNTLAVSLTGLSDAIGSQWLGKPLVVMFNSVNDPNVPDPYGSSAFVRAQFDNLILDGSPTPLPSPILFYAAFDNTTQAVDGQGAAVAPWSVTGNVTYMTGKVGQALECGGDGALVNYPVTGHVHASQGAVSMWVKALDWPAGEQVFHVFFETQGPGWLVLYKFWSGGLLMLSGSDLSHYASAMMNTCPLTDGQWHHLAGVWSAQSLSLYVDGTLRATLPTPPLPQSLQGSFTVGDDPWGTPHASHTLLDEVTVYRYALPADQIALLAQNKPLTYQPSLQVAVQPLPTQGKWNVNVNAAGLVASDGGPGSSVVVQILGDDNVTVVSSGTITSFTEGMGSILMDISSVSAGPHVVRAILQNAAGQELLRTQTTFTKPADAPWINNPRGMTDKVLPPFTAMAANSAAKTVGCWNRSYMLNGAFPGQIISGGQSLLAGSGMYLTVTQGSSTITLPTGTGTIGSSSATKVQHTGSASAGGYTLSTASTLEYDGMLWTDVTLSAGSSVTLSNATLHIPVNAAHAQYFHHACGSYFYDNAGLLPAGGWTNTAVGFQPFLWVGDDDRGLAWFAESMKGWSNPGIPPQNIVRTDNATVEMQISFINQATVINGSVSFSFGLQATPVKPRAADARSWRFNGWDDLGNDIGGGTLRIVWPVPGGYMSYFGYPWPVSPDNFTALVNSCHSQGIRVVVYVNLNYVAPVIPDYAYYGAEWVNPGTSQASGMGYNVIGTCPDSTAWRDYIAYRVADFVEAFDVDGLYIDCWEPNSCLVEDHDGVAADGCGWRDAGGVLHGRVPIRESREIVRRVREIFQDDNVTNVHLTIHMSGAVTIPMLAFADTMLDGEQYQAGAAGAPNDDYLSVVPLDKWRTQNTGRQWGVVPLFLPEFAYGDNRTQSYPTDRLMGILLAHDVNVWPAWCNTQTVFNAWNLIKGFGIDNATFLPYWTGNGVSTGNPQVVASVYQKPGQALLVVLNSSTSSASVTVTVDGNRLLGGTAWQAWNTADSSSIAVSNQSFTISSLPGRGYKLVTLTASNILSGTVVLQNYGPNPNGMPVSIQLRKTGGDNTTYSSFLDQNGRFAISGVASGSYVVWIKAGHWLSSLANVTFTTGYSDMGTVSLTNGDADGDNTITSTDLSIVLAAMDTVEGSPRFDSRADLDGDGMVTCADLSIVLANME